MGGQRGTGESQPLLRCSEHFAEPAIRAYFAAATPRSAVAHAAWWKGYLVDCRRPFDEAGFRSLTLDSVSLYQRPDVVLGNVAEAFDRALEQVARDCIQDEACHAAYPIVLGDFERPYHG